ncbi:hypothetical protein T4D_4622 [Trichinella pseudospiralis]|uniref:Uncharacterized protein n=1 Tax=Trichinella pseudospiralis TaxID=6337 RepID=A0A0V1F5H2_TRIPS|nr:hypothetical protein T4D_4622 [Trichinella pseudospiralis]
MNQQSVGNSNNFEQLINLNLINFWDLFYKHKKAKNGIEEIFELQNCYDFGMTSACKVQFKPRCCYLHI